MPVDNIKRISQRLCYTNCMKPNQINAVVFNVSNHARCTYNAFISRDLLWPNSWTGRRFPAGEEKRINSPLAGIGSLNSLTSAWAAFICERWDERWKDQKALMRNSAPTDPQPRALSKLIQVILKYMTFFSVFIWPPNHSDSALWAGYIWKCHFGIIMEMEMVVSHPVTSWWSCDREGCSCERVCWCFLFEEYYPFCCICIKKRQYP